MSLDWNLTGIDGYETLCWLPDPDNEAEGGDGKMLNPITNALIWSTLSVGIGEITERNALEFYTRLSLAERVYGPSLTMFDPEVNDMVLRPLTHADVRAHIGLRTNVFPKVTDAAWLKNLLRNHADEVQRAWKREQEAVTAT